LDDKGKTANTTDLEIEASPTLGRYQCGRNGDHLMGVSFECNLCLFRNVCGRQPEFKNKRDQFTLTAIWRAQLDVMWARELHTMATNWVRAKADYYMTMRHLVSVLLESLLPQLGSTEVRDQVGMVEILTTLVTSLRLGRNSTNIQWDTMQKTRTWLSNAHDAGREYTRETAVGMDRAKQYVTSGHTLEKWFGRFMRGARLRMGMIRKQNEALTSALATAVCEAAKAHWSLATEEGVKEELEDTICFMLAAFGAGLRGEEVPLMSMEGLLTFWTVSREAEDRHIMLALKGHFKEEVDERCHLVPVSDFMRLGLPFRLWMERALHHQVNLQNQLQAGCFKTGRGYAQNLVYTITFSGTLLTDQRSCILGSCLMLWRLETSVYGDPQGGRLS